MSSELSAYPAVSGTETGASEPCPDFPKMFPQIFTRKGEVRVPKGVAKNKDSMALKMKKFSAIYKTFKDLTVPDAELRIIIPGGSLSLTGDCMVEFMSHDEGSYLLDLIANGWSVFYI